MVPTHKQTIELGDGYTELGATTDDGTTVTIDASAFVDAVGSYTIYYDATDAGGNVAEQVTRTVNVVDTTAPVITLTGANPQTIELGDGYSELGASTNDGTTVTIDASAFMDAVGSYTIYYDATDVNGNDAVQVTRTVNVIDSSGPTVICQNITLQLDSTGNASLTAAEVDNGSNDPSGIASISIDRTSFSCADIGTVSVTLTVTDNNGQINSCMATVTIVDAIAPSILVRNFTVALDASGNVTINPEDVDSGSTDACGIAMMSLSQDTFDCTMIGENTVTLTVTDTNGNSSQLNATVTVIDDTAPVFNISTLPTDQEVTFNNATENAYVVPDYTASVEVSDNCDSLVRAINVTQSPEAGTELAAGEHTITITTEDSQGNIETYTFIVTVNSTLSIEDNVIPGLEVYPIPTKGKVFISIEAKEIVLYNISGQKITATAGKELDLTNYQAGVYFAHITTDKGTDVIRVVKD